MVKEITKNINKLNIFGFEQTGYCAVVSDMASYYEASFDLLKADIRHELFNSDIPILTRIKTNAPALHGFNGKVKNSLIADGCVIDGNIENCIVFRGVTIGEGAELENCIIFQDSVIGAGAKLSCVITDKGVTVKEGQELSGHPTYPFVIAKGKTV